jgi:hypothetical protein
VIVAIAMSGGGGSEPPSTTAASGQATGQIQMAVPSEQLWTATSLSCNAGDVFDVSASGTVLHNKDDANSAVDPNGIHDVPNADFFHQFNVEGLPDANTASLVASVDPIDDVGQDPQFIGDRGSYHCKRTGKLFLGINDRGVANNQGHWDATVQLQSG